MTGVADTNAPEAAAPSLWQRVSRVDPRYQVAALITLVLLAAQFRYHVLDGYDSLVLALLTCTVTEAVLSWFERGKVVNLQSAYISGISLTLLLRPQGSALWPFVLGGILAISSKYVLRSRNNHLWNPTNLAITALLLMAPARVSVLSQQWGNDFLTNLVIWGFGLAIAARVGVIHITLAYAASFLVLSATRALAFGQPVAPELAPITGPMYQLFVFFMITDPRTIVRGKRKQVAVAVIIALVEALIRLAADQGWPLPIAFTAAPPIVALAIVGPVAKWIDLRKNALNAKGTPAPAPSLAAQAVLPSADRGSSPAARAGR